MCTLWAKKAQEEISSRVTKSKRELACFNRRRQGSSRQPKRLARAAPTAHILVGSIEARFPPLLQAGAAAAMPCSRATGAPVSAAAAVCQQKRHHHRHYTWGGREKFAAAVLGFVVVVVCKHIARLRESFFLSFVRCFFLSCFIACTLLALSIAST